MQSARHRLVWVLRGFKSSGLRMRARIGASLVTALVAVSFVLPASQGAAQTVEWTAQFGTSSSDGALGVALDSTGDSYVAGYTDGTLPGQTSAGDQDAFVAKYDPSGSQLWLRQFGTSSSDRAQGVAVDSSGNAYVVGFTYGAFPGQTLAGVPDALVAKYDASGNQLWVRQFGTHSSDVALGVAVDPAGNAYVAGFIGSRDAFVAKYDPVGNRRWVRQFGTERRDSGYGVAVDSSGNAYVAGSTDGAFPGQTWAGFTDAFVAKYDPSGNQLWVHQFGTSSGDAAYGVAVDPSDNAYVAGYTAGTFPGQTSEGSDDAFVAKYDPSGSQLWVHQFGTSSGDVATGLAMDSSGNAYVAGSTDGAFPGQTSAGIIDAFVAEYDPSGSQLWVHQFGTAGTDFAQGVAVDSSRNASVAGGTDGAFPGQTSAGIIDAFVAQVSSQPPVPPQCGDGVDNDADAKVDFGTGPSNDPGCESATDDSESPDPPPPPAGSCMGHPATIDRSPTPSGETINGTPGDDVIIATSGDDTINGNGGNDIVCAGPGDDVITTGDGDDRIRGQDGNDTIRSDAGNDRVWGNAGDDHVFAGSGDDWAKGGTGTDVVRGQGGNDKVFGSDGDDTAYGNDGDDAVDGGPGDDAVLGGKGIDDCTGGESYSGCETIG